MKILKNRFKIRKGTTRIVFLFKDFVVKIPNFTFCWKHFILGIYCNMQENITWKYSSGKYEKGLSYLLCPVLWASWGGWILVMKRADLTQPLYEEDTKEHMKFFGGDDSLDNYGNLDGKIVKIDYGQLN